MFLVFGRWSSEERSPFCCSLGGACLEPEAVVSGFQDMAVMGESIEESCGHLGVAEHVSPFAKAEIGRHGDTGALLELTE
jgi:phospholipase/lecithinase/hemolysin